MGHLVCYTHYSSPVAVFSSHHYHHPCIPLLHLRRLQ